MSAPLSVVIPTLDAGAELSLTLACLGDANARGLIRDVVVSDGGSTDQTRTLAEDAGCRGERRNRVLRRVINPS